MSSFGVMNRQARDIAALMVVMLATIMSAFVPALVSAAQITERSIQLSSSTVSASGVSYLTTFTATTAEATGAVVVQFCANSPLIGDVCDAPAGFSAASATASGGATLSGTPTANQVIVSDAIVAGSNSFTLGNITNPSAAGSLYARILTYASTSDANAYSVDSSTSTLGSPVDQGSVAMSITNTVGVSAAVLESMTFCVAGAEITAASCGGTLAAPTLALGETTGGVKSLSSTLVSTGDIYTQLSTNAASGVTVNLKSGNSCGGLKRAEATGCDIAPALKTGITGGQAKVGVIVAPYTTNDTSLSASGTFQAVAGSGYNDTTYALNFNGTTDGVASVYGDPMLDTNGTQPNNKEMKLTFGASAANNTPAGLYTNNYSLIATGKF